MGRLVADAEAVTPSEATPSASTARPYRTQLGASIAVNTQPFKRRSTRLRAETCCGSKDLGLQRVDGGVVLSGDENDDEAEPKAVPDIKFKAAPRVGLGQPSVVVMPVYLVR